MSKIIRQSEHYQSLGDNETWWVYFHHSLILFQEFEVRIVGLWLQCGQIARLFLTNRQRNELAPKKQHHSQRSQIWEYSAQPKCHQDSGFWAG